MTTVPAPIPLPCPFCGVKLTPNNNQADLYVRRYGTHYNHINNGCFLGGDALTPADVPDWNKRV